MDAVIIVCSPAGTELRDQMECVVLATCRECKQQVAADSHTIARAAANNNTRRFRPIDFLCLPCYPKFEEPTVKVDDRPTLNRKLN